MSMAQLENWTTWGKDEYRSSTVQFILDKWNRADPPLKRKPPGHRAEKLEGTFKNIAFISGGTGITPSFQVTLDIFRSEGSDVSRLCNIFLMIKMIQRDSFWSLGIDLKTTFFLRMSWMLMLNLVDYRWHTLWIKYQQIVMMKMDRPEVIGEGKLEW